MELLEWRWSDRKRTMLPVERVGKIRKIEGDDSIDTSTRSTPSTSLASTVSRTVFRNTQLLASTFSFLGDGDRCQLSQTCTTAQRVGKRPESWPPGRMISTYSHNPINRRIASIVSEQRLQELVVTSVDQRTTSIKGGGGEYGLPQERSDSHCQIDSDDKTLPLAKLLKSSQESLRSLKIIYPAFFLDFNTFRGMSSWVPHLRELTIRCSDRLLTALNIVPRDQLPQKLNTFRVTMVTMVGDFISLLGKFNAIHPLVEVEVEIVELPSVNANRDRVCQALSKLQLKKLTLRSGIYRRQLLVAHPTGQDDTVSTVASPLATTLEELTLERTDMRHLMPDTDSKLPSLGECKKLIKLDYRHGFTASMSALMSTLIPHLSLKSLTFDVVVKHLLDAVSIHPTIEKLIVIHRRKQRETDQSAFRLQRLPPLVGSVDVEQVFECCD